MWNRKLPLIPASRESDRQWNDFEQNDTRRLGRLTAAEPLMITYIFHRRKWIWETYDITQLGSARVARSGMGYDSQAIALKFALAYGPKNATIRYNRPEVVAVASNKEKNHEAPRVS